MGRTLENSMAEKEANEIAFKFMNSNDVVKDMSAAYNVDFSGINFHSDASADAKVKSAGKDAIASGNDIFFGKGILESNDAASKGLVAHELAHTMQQGVVESSGVVSESVSEGAEQGGKFTDFFKKLFGKKKMDISEPTAMGVANDEESLNYMAAMRAKEKELDIEKFKDKIRTMKAGMPDLVAESNKAYEKNKNNTEISDELLTSYALVGLGHRSSKKDAEIRRDFMDIMKGKYKRNWETIDEKGIDYKAANSSYNEFDNGHIKYLHNDYTNEITSGIMKIVGEGLESDKAKMYNYEFINGVKDAKIFEKISPIDYFFSTVFTGEGARLGEARNKFFGTKFTQQGVDFERNEVFKNAQKNLALLPALSNLSDDKRNELPPSLINLYEQYKVLCKKIEEQIANYQPQ